MSTRKNPARLGTKASAPQPHPANHLDEISEQLTSGDAVTPSPTARQRPGEPTGARMYQGQNNAPPGQQTQPADPSIYGENGMLIQGRDPAQQSHSGEGEERLFKELLTPRRGHSPPAAFYTMRSPQEEMILQGRKPVPVPARPALYDLTYLRDNVPEGEPYSMDTDPIARTPPDYHYQLTPPTDPLFLATQFNPMELPQELRNPNGTNSIVQSTEHAYALMAMEQQARAHMHMTGRPGATIDSVYVNEDGMSYTAYSDGRPQGHVRQQQTSPTSWQRTSGSSGGTWSAHQSPTVLPRGWQQASPRNQGQDQPGTPQQQQGQQEQSTPPVIYRTQANWPQAQEQSNTGDRRLTPPSPSPAFWHPGTGSGQGPSPQSAATHLNVRPREVSWSQGDPNRPSPSHPSASGARWTGPGPSPVTTTNPAGWGPPPPNSMPNAPPSIGVTWQTQGGQPRSAGPLHHQPHSAIDGPSDDGTRWSSPNNTTEPSVPRGWHAASSEGSTTMVSTAGDGAGSVVGSAPGTRYTVDESGRPTQVRILGINAAGMMGSNPMSSMTWSQVQGNPRPPWMNAQMSNPAGTLPPDGRIQTPGGTGAMGGGHAASARPPTTTTQMTGSYPAPAAPGYPAYANRPGSVQGQPRPGEYAPVAGNEMPYGSQPDSMAPYRGNNGPGGGMPPPPVASGPPQGYNITNGPVPTGNPYPPVPPATGATYGISRPGMVPQQQQQPRQQQHHHQPPPNAHGNMYPSVYTLQQQQQPPQPQPSGMNGSVYAPYTSTGGPPTVTYPMNPGPPMARTVTRVAPGPGRMPMNAYGAMDAPQGQPQQDMYGRMGPGGMEGYRPQQ